MAKTLKFGDTERKRVINHLENIKKITLTPVSGRKIFLLGSDDNYYCVVGGSEDWHRIPNEVMSTGMNFLTKIFLVVARLLRTRIEVFMGSMKPVIESRDTLKRTRTGDYQFDIKSPQGPRLGIKQIVGANLYKIGDIDYEAIHEREKYQKISEFIRSLSSAELDALANELGIKFDT